MKTKFILSLVFLFGFTNNVFPQELLNQLRADTIKLREITALSLDSSYAMVIISSPIPNLFVETSSRKIIRSYTEEGRRIIFLPEGTQKLTFSAMGYKPLELEPYSFIRGRVYDIRIIEVRAPRLSAIGHGSLSINTKPQGATLVIDGIPGQWTTPVTFTNMLATTYSISIYKEKFETLSITATVIQDSIVQLPDIKLVPKFGFLKIITDLDAQIFIDGRQIGYKMDSFMELPIGTHTIEIVKNRFKPWSKKVQMHSGESITLTKSLKELKHNLNTDKKAKLNLIDQTIVHLKNANIAFNAPETMKVMETWPVVLLVSEDISSTALVAKVTSLITDSTKIGRIYKDTIILSTKMEAHLSGDGFAVTPITPIQQLVLKGSETRWEWIMRAEQQGNRTLYLTLNAFIEYKGKETTQTIKTYRKKIFIYIETITIVKAWLNQNIAWIASIVGSIFSLFIGYYLAILKEKGKAKKKR